MLWIHQTGQTTIYLQRNSKTLLILTSPTCGHADVVANCGVPDEAHVLTSPTCGHADVVANSGVPDEAHVLSVSLLLLVHLQPEHHQVLPVLGKPLPEPDQEQRNCSLKG